MVWLRLAAIAILIVPAITVADAQVLPPPLLPEQAGVTEQLVRAFKDKDAAGYAALLADDVQVFEDGRSIAHNKAEWLKVFGPKFAAPGVSFKLTSGYTSAGRLLFIEYFNSLASWGRTPPPDCCWGYDAVAYDVAGGKITVIRRLWGGAYRLGDDGAIVGF